MPETIQVLGIALHLLRYANSQKEWGGYLNASLGMKTHWFLLFKLRPAIQKKLYFLWGVCHLDVFYFFFNGL